MIIFSENTENENLRETSNTFGYKEPQNIYVAKYAITKLNTQNEPAILFPIYRTKSILSSIGVLTNN